MRVLSALGFGYPQGPGTDPLWIQGTTAATLHQILRTLMLAATSVFTNLVKGSECEPLYEIKFRDRCGWPRHTAGLTASHVGWFILESLDFLWVGWFIVVLEMESRAWTRQVLYHCFRGPRPVSLFLPTDLQCPLCKRGIPPRKMRVKAKLSAWHTAGA